MSLPTEPIGSIPRPEEVIEGLKAYRRGDLSQEALDQIADRALRATIGAFEDTGSPVITDGEQAKPSFLTYPIEGADNVEPGGVEIPFEAGHTRTLPHLTAGPFRYQTYAAEYLERAQAYASVPVKQSVISASALSFLYPDDGLDGYSRAAFLEDLVDEVEADIRRCLDAGAHAVQMDFTEGRLAVKLDPSKGLLREFVALNNRVLDRFSDEARQRIGVHTCPGGDKDSTHSADVDYAELLPLLFDLNVGRFYMQFASEDEPARVLDVVREHSTDDQTIFLGVTDVNDPRVESPEEVRDTILRAAEHLSPERLGTTDDCGFSPFGDDRSTARRTAFHKIEARVEGTRRARQTLGRPE
ncbi:5-methyltetrahydropteroyltriglutamate--homocysteine methyltransferase [Salinibacter ruber]|uniref:cobalamin-independent methionine synthase II family protein n=1 Tax=Salinibacter ruber TaxID=146919 RepID=UPI00216A43C7|nr:cobalamin-independent methionine synthase II family protein [Salinibacter ruber]MCS3751543.1 5-methyltetrahydropteroyltriglutamate--homocysteine methyltransferase [Salinibacter ruber]